MEEYCKPKIKRKNTNQRCHRKLSLSDESFNVLYGWLEKNIQNPYPSKETKLKVAIEAKISISKLNKWLQNERAKFKKSKKKLVVSHPSVKNKFLEEFFA